MQQWGRKESIIWPPRGFYYTYGAIFLAHRGYRISDLCPLRIRPCLAAAVLPALLSADRDCGLHASHQHVPAGLYHRRKIARPDRARRRCSSRARRHNCPARPLPFALSAAALAQGFRYLVREPTRPYQNKGCTPGSPTGYTPTHPSTGIFATPLYWGILALSFAASIFHPQRHPETQGTSVWKAAEGADPGQARASSRMPLPATASASPRTMTSRPLRVPRNAENKHFLVVGDTGSGKSSIIRQMLYQVADRGDSAIVYDPACEFVKQFYDERRGDIVLNPLDARMPYWNPSDELRRKAEAKALAVSLYQPEGVTNRFFVEAPQKIFAHLMTYLPTPNQLVSWMSNPAEIDRRIKGTEYWMLIDTKAPHQRTGVLGSLNMSADSFRLLPSQLMKFSPLGLRQNGPRLGRVGSSLRRARRCARLSVHSSVCGLTCLFCGS